MRGNVFGGLGQPPRHPDPRRNVPGLTPRRHACSVRTSPPRSCSSLSISAVLAVLAKVVSSAFGARRRSRLSTSWSISVVGAILSSIVVLVITVAVAAFCARRSLDLDNVAAPIVTAAGDIVDAPSLFLATYLIGFHFVTPMIAVVCVALAVGALVAAIRRRPAHPASHRARVVAGPRARRRVDMLAGITIRSASTSFLTFPALFVLVPRLPRRLGITRRDPGGTRSSTKLHLGTLGPGAGAVARRHRRRAAHLHVRDPRVRLPRRVVDRVRARRRTRPVPARRR